MMFRGAVDENVEERLDVLAGLNKKKSRGMSDAEKSLLAGPLDDVPGQLERYLSQAANLKLLIEQADVNMSLATLMMICLALFAVGVGAALIAGLNLAIGLLAGAVVCGLPILWLLFKRSRRRKAFGRQLPEALELISRALRAGHSLQAGFQLVGDEMSDPIGTEFTRVFEEQNLGMSLEETLNNMTDRMPNLDLKFFATAVVLQRQTGGDLAEILDKIGELVRERFKIHGQIQALTGEGRLSGIVLLALPPVLFLTMLKMNYDYAVTLFTDPMGKKMLAFAVVMQIFGAIVIKKIISIKV